MDTERFRVLLPSIFHEVDSTTRPKDRRFGVLLEDVAGMSSANKLALLNLAARLLPPDEAYVEVGSWKGLSTIAAMLDNDRSPFYAIDKFREHGSREEVLPNLLSNLERWRVRERLNLIQEDAFVALGSPTWLKAPVGAYFYDGDHGRLAHYLALGLVEPLLADDALIIIDDSSWPVVARSTEKYVRNHRGYELLFSFESNREFDPEWWNGVRVYRFSRPENSRERGLGLDIFWRRLVQLYAYDPVTSAAFRLMRNPQAASLLRRLLPLKGRRVPTDGAGFRAGPPASS